MWIISSFRLRDNPGTWNAFLFHQDSFWFAKNAHPSCRVRMT
jgi:hypothetical protein